MSETTLYLMFLLIYYLLLPTHIIRFFMKEDTFSIMLSTVPTTLPLMCACLVNYKLYELMKEKVANDIYYEMKTQQV